VVRLALFQVHHLALSSRLKAFHESPHSVDEKVRVLGQHHGHLFGGVHEPQLSVGLVGGNHVGDASVLQEVNYPEVQRVIDAVGELGEKRGPFGTDVISF
jgi:hypothetical protein